MRLKLIISLIISSLLENIAGSFLVVVRQPGDREDPRDLSSALQSFTEESFYVDFSNEAKIPRIPKPGDSSENNGSSRTYLKNVPLQFLMMLVFKYLL